MSARVISTCISEKKGTKKHPVPYITVIEGHGITSDAHAGAWHRQISLLADESVDKMRALGAELKAGDFAENILTRGIELTALTIGTRLKIGATVLEITQIGKECHNDCEIRRLTGKCVMPTEGIFTRVVSGGVIYPGDTIEIEVNDETDKND